MNNSNFHSQVIKADTMKKVKAFITRYNDMLKNYYDMDPDDRCDLRDETLAFYKKLIIGTDMEKRLVKNYNDECRYLSRTKENDYDSEYETFKSADADNPDNIVRKQLAGEDDEYEDYLRKIMDYSNKIAHEVENDAIRYMGSLGFRQGNMIPSTSQEKLAQDGEEKKFISKLRGAYDKFIDAEQDNYTFDIPSAAKELFRDDFDPNNISDVHVQALQKLMQDSGFRRASNSKDAMINFLYCLRTESCRDMFYKMKENAFIDFMIEHDDLGKDSKLKTVYTKDVIKDSQGRETIRVLIVDKKDAKVYKDSGARYISDNLRRSIKEEHKDEIKNLVQKEEGMNEEKALKFVIDESYPGQDVSIKEMLNLRRGTRASSIHIPMDNLETLKEMGIEMEETKDPTEISLAYTGSTTTFYNAKEINSWQRDIINKGIRNIRNMSKER